MKSHYKTLGNYIREVTNINTDFSVNYLRGISSIYKSFIKSKANIVGVDFLDYKIVHNDQFAFNPNTARMGDKIPIALNDGENCIVSKIYPVFEIIDKQQLCPEYLMMWFKRSEFDRYARFKSHGSAREIFDWEEMCKVKLPIPTIDVQKKIVKEYNTIINRIALNNQLIQKLEETVQLIYKQWFVDFEFPDEEGKSFKSNGGEMVESEFGEIPIDWKVTKVKALCECNYATLSPKDKFTTIEYLDTSNITDNEIEEITTLNMQWDIIPSRAKRKVTHNDIIFSTVRPNLRHFGILKNINSNMIVSTGFAVLKATYPNLCSELLYLTLIQEENLQNLQAGAEMSVSTYPSINPDDLMDIDFILPARDILVKAKSVLIPCFDLLGNLQKEKKLLKSTSDIFLSKLATIEN